MYFWGTGEGVLQEKRVNLKNCKVSGGSSQVKITENDRCGHSCRCNMVAKQMFCYLDLMQPNSFLLSFFEVFRDNLVLGF